MADQSGRQPFRFRLPWVISPAPTPIRAPEPQPPRPPIRPPTARPFFPATRTESQPPSRVGSQPSSPTRQSLQTQVISQPPSPALTAPPSRVASQPPSPSKTLQVVSSQLPSSAPPSRIVSQPPSPPRTAPPSQAASQPSSPPKPIAPPTQVVSSQPATPSRVASQRTSPPKPITAPIQVVSSPIPKGPASSSPLFLTVEQRETKIAPQPQPSSPIKTDKRAQTPPALSLPPPSMPIPDAQRDIRALDTKGEAIKEEKPRRKPEARKEEKPKIPAAEKEPKQRTITELPSVKPASDVQQPKRHIGYKSQEQSKQEKPTSGEEKEITTTASTKEKKKIASPIFPKDRTSRIETHLKPSVLHRGEERPAFHKDIRDDVSRLVYKLGSVGHPKQYSSITDENPVSVITLAGDNKGASMQLGPNFARKEASIHIHRGYKLNQQDEISEQTTDGESSSSKERKKSREPIRGKEEQKASRAFVNSNVQGVNNSIMFNSSCSERSPGIHLMFSHDGKEISTEGKGAGSASKAEFTISQPQKQTYEPPVRRRCLRGLFLEPSDSEPDNPNKPRRHGCRYNCKQEKNIKETAVNE